MRACVRACVRVQYAHMHVSERTYTLRDPNIHTVETNLN